MEPVEKRIFCITPGQFAHLRKRAYEENTNMSKIIRGLLDKDIGNNVQNSSK